MEKRRRARINESLSQLKTLILDALKKDVSGNAAFFFFSIKMKYHFSGTKRETRPPPPLQPAGSPPPALRSLRPEGPAPPGSGDVGAAAGEGSDPRLRGRWQGSHFSALPPLLCRARGIPSWRRRTFWK